VVDGILLEFVWAMPGPCSISESDSSLDFWTMGMRDIAGQTSSYGGGNEKDAERVTAQETTGKVYFLASY
jgi:hypothetical protein